MNHYTVISGDGSRCEHQHSTYTGAERCCRSWINENAVDLRLEASESETSWEKYKEQFIDEAVFVDDDGDLYLP